MKNGKGIRDGVDGWELVTYKWNPATEDGLFRYERQLKGKAPEVYETLRHQPIAEAIKRSGT